MSFSSLPFDVLLGICQAVDAISNRGIYKPTSLSSSELIVNGRRVVAKTWDGVPDSLLTLSCVNKRTRDACEPLLFETIVFGSKWEALGELRWASAKARMKVMIQKQSLKHLVKSLVWVSSSEAPWDTIHQNRPQFWAVFGKFMQHLEHVDYVQLGFWTRHIDPYPISWQKRNVHLTKDQLVAHWAGSSDEAPAATPRLPLLTSCIPCVPGPMLKVGKKKVREDLSDQGPYIFPNVKAVRLSRGSQWFAAHCPNLEHLEDTGVTITRRDFDLTLLGRTCTRVRTLETCLAASPKLITEILNYFPALETLVITAPTFNGPGSERQIQNMAPLFANAAHIQVLKFRRPNFMALFPLRGEQFRKTLDATTLAFAEHSSSLRQLNLGDFEYCREGPRGPFGSENDIESISSEEAFRLQYPCGLGCS